MKQIEYCRQKKLYRKCRTDLKELERILNNTGEITVLNDLHTISDGNGNLISVYPAFINNNETFISKRLLDFMLNKQIAMKV